ncbi:methionyl-tRNA formyltransferase [Nonlabens sp.]|uniref:methionyl-tRNA formyltransferase n=1 Tax=Nonlabens sp. TaxID=1888209 RepID=UPI0025D6046C|nr:methionyl-tRNA formyltransferase [Nonlabens sp.]
MNKSLKIVFFGTPEFATGVLQALQESPHEIVAVVTVPDKPAGRGRKINESDVKKYAVTHGLPVLQPHNLKAADFLKELASFKADVQVVVAFRMLPKAVWKMPPMGTFNLHASLLPQYRGAAPINWVIINQEKQTGVSTFFIDEKIDTGAIIATRETLIAPLENAGTLYNRLMNMGAQLTLKTVDAIAAGTVTTTIQKNHPHLKEAPKLTNENTFIDFNKPAVTVDALIRGLYPYPVAKAVLFNEKNIDVKIYKSKVVEKSHKMTPGSLVLENNQILVACAEDMIEIQEIQLPNKKRMNVKDLLNGYTFAREARFGKALGETALKRL